MVQCRKGTVKDYKYNEPSDLESIKALRKPYPLSGKVDKDTIEDKIHGAWIGRIAGCFLGKVVEGIRTDEFIPFLKKTDNYPMHRYILSTDCNGATVGSVLGMAGGYDAVGEEWKAHLCDTLETTIFGYEKVKISECAKKTMKHVIFPSEEK